MIRFLVLVSITICLSLHGQAQQGFDPYLVEIEGNLGTFQLDKRIKKEQDSVYLLTIRLQSETEQQIPGFTVKWNLPSQNIYTIWDNKFNSGRSNYNLKNNSRIGGALALLSYIDKRNYNRFTFGISDNTNTIKIENKLKEEDANFYISLGFFNDNPPKRLTKAYTVTIRFDLRSIRYERSLNDMAKWWQSFYPPAHTPKAAIVPLYSTWYNFHHHLTEKEILKECNIAKELGMDAIIIDAGWMTLNDETDFSTVGDYKPKRLKHIKKLVAEIHALEMKVMLWYATSMAGIDSEAAHKFKGKFIRKDKKRFIYDPRYPEVREHLIVLLENALKEWDIDGVKLDFMSKMYPDPDTPVDKAEGRDYASIDQATDRWFKDIYNRLRKINPEVLIEFRQPHINPVTQQYGNMFRAIDNFNMEIANRIYISKIRLTSPGLATHSDMLKWHTSDSTDDAALQVLNGIFSVPQISIKLDSISKGHRTMIGFWMKYWSTNKNILMHENFRADHPGENYTALHGFDHKKQITALYTDQVVQPKSNTVNEIDLINATSNTTLYFDPLDNFSKEITIETYSSEGKPLDTIKKVNTGTPIKIMSPKVGLIRIRNTK